MTTDNMQAKSEPEKLQELQEIGNNAVQSTQMLKEYLRNKHSFAVRAVARTWLNTIEKLLENER